MNLLERWRARRDPRRRQPFETPAIWQSRRLVERSNEHPPELGPVVLPEDVHLQQPTDPLRSSPVVGVRMTQG